MYCIPKPGEHATTTSQPKKERKELSFNRWPNTSISDMPSNKKKNVDIELMKKRKSIIEARIAKLEAKLEKDKKLIIKYTPPPPPPEEESDEKTE
jgi:hypothetical protein